MLHVPRHRFVTIGLPVILFALAGCGESDPLDVEVNQTTENAESADTVTASPPSIVTSSLPDGRTGEPYSIELSATGGVVPYRWSLIAGSVPQGLSLSEEGLLEGVPLASGEVEFSIIVSDQNELADTADFSIAVELTFPEPDLVLDGYVRATNGYEFVHYDLSVENWSAYAPELFEARPDLPPCGLNTSASRTWVEIYDRSGRRMYGFCALASPENLNGIWVAVQTSAEQPSGVYIELWDRARDVRVRSNIVDTPSAG